MPTNPNLAPPAGAGRWSSRYALDSLVLGDERPPMKKSLAGLARALGWRRREQFLIENSRAMATKLAELEGRISNAPGLRLAYPGRDGVDRLTTSICRQSDYSLDAYAHWIARTGRRVQWHRKQWEYFFILQALYERGRLAPGMSGLGFGVGREPLSAAIAALGATVLATDLATAAAGWDDIGREAASLSELNIQKLCPDEDFKRLVTFREADMRKLPEDLPKVDFTWSACAFEHLGSLQQGFDFLIASSRFLKAGGVGVHTTEYNVSSNDRTVETGDTVLYRRRDLDALGLALDAIGCDLLPFDERPADGVLDGYVDVPPFASPHLRLALGEFTVTSVGLIIVRRS
jgi:hypothetical protein